MKTLILLLAGIVPAFAQTSATLSVTADGTQPFTYSWKKDGALIAGASSSSLVLSPLTTAASGLYLAQVVNSAGSAVAPANVIVMGTTTTAPAVDLSKQYLEAAIASPWSPTPQVAPNFVIAPVKKVSDPGNHFDDSTGIYTVGDAEAGTYSIAITIRTQDKPPGDVSIGLTAGTTNTDTLSLWAMTPKPPTDPTLYWRWGTEHTITTSFKAGAKIRFNIYVESAIALQGYGVVLRRLF